MAKLWSSNLMLSVMGGRSVKASEWGQATAHIQRDYTNTEPEEGEIVDYH